MPKTNYQLALKELQKKEKRYLRKQIISELFGSLTIVEIITLVWDILFYSAVFYVLFLLIIFLKASAPNL